MLHNTYEQMATSDLDEKVLAHPKEKKEYYISCFTLFILLMLLQYCNLM